MFVRVEAPCFVWFLVEVVVENGWLVCCWIAPLTSCMADAFEDSSDDSLLNPVCNVTGDTPSLHGDTTLL